MDSISILTLDCPLPICHLSVVLPEREISSAKSGVLKNPVTASRLSIKSHQRRSWFDACCRLQPYVKFDMQSPPASYFAHRRKTLPIVMPDDSDPMHDQQPNDDQRRPEVQGYPASPPPTAEQHTPSFAGRASIGLDVPGAVQTREPPGEFYPFLTLTCYACYIISPFRLVTQRP